MTDYAVQRSHMVESQLSTNDVADPRIRLAMAAVPREQFVPEARRAMAYCDLSVEVSPGRYLLEPRCVAKLLVLANVRPTDHVLDVACATGYSTAVLAQLVRSVVAVEQDGDLMRQAVERLRGATNVTVVQGALAEGAKVQAPYDLIVVEGGIEEAPAALLAQLAESGRLVSVLQRGAQGRAHIFVREHGRVGSRPDFDASVPVLAGFRKSVEFVF